MDLQISKNFKSKIKFSLPSIEVDEEPILLGCMPETKSDDGVNIPHNKLIHLGEQKIGAKYFPNPVTPKMQRARYVRRFVLSTIKFKKIEIPLQSRVISCEIVYQDFSIKEVRLRCEFPYSVNLEQEILYNHWVTEEAPQSSLDEDYNCHLNLPPDEKHYFVYHSVDTEKFGRRIFFSWKTPKKIDGHKIRGKAPWTLPY